MFCFNICWHYLKSFLLQIASYTHTQRIIYVYNSNLILMPIIYIQLPHNSNFNSISKDLWIAMFNYWKFSVQFYRLFRQIVHSTQDIILPNRVKVRGMVFNATFNNISVISWWLKPEYTEKTTDLPQVTDKYINVVSSTPCLSGIRTHNVSGDRQWLHR